MHAPPYPMAPVPPAIDTLFMVYPIPENRWRRIPGYGGLFLRRRRYQQSATQDMRQARPQVRRERRSVAGSNRMMVVVVFT